MSFRFFSPFLRSTQPKFHKSYSATHEKTTVGRLWDGKIAGAMLNFRGIYIPFTPLSLFRKEAILPNEETVHLDIKPAQFKMTFDDSLKPVLTYFSHQSDLKRLHP